MVAGALLAYGFSRSDDDRQPIGTTPPPTIGVIQAPAQVATTVSRAAVTPGSSPDTADVPTIPPGTADVAFPPVGSNDIPTP